MHVRIYMYVRTSIQCFCNAYLDNYMYIPIELIVYKKASSK